jgi:hypothetical protein
MPTLPSDGRLTNEEVARVIEWARTALRLTYAEIGSMVRAEADAVAQWHQRFAMPMSGSLRPLQALADLRARLEAIFPDEPEVAVSWLQAPVPALRGEAPLNVIRRGKISRVLDCLPR